MRIPIHPSDRISRCQSFIRYQRSSRVGPTCENLNLTNSPILYGSLCQSSPQQRQAPPQIGLHRLISALVRDVAALDPRGPYIDHNRSIRSKTFKPAHIHWDSHP